MYPQYYLGIELVDKEHSVLFDLLEDLTRLTYTTPTRDQCFEKVSVLFEYVMTHVAHEERLLEDQGWPGLTQHRLLHAALSRDLDALFEELMAMTDLNCLIFVEKMHAFVLGWWGNHIQEEDAGYVEVLKERLAVQ
jgi:hemerythrin